jgi:hypothetical protein
MSGERDDEEERLWWEAVESIIRLKWAEKCAAAPGPVTEADLGRLLAEAREEVLRAAREQVDRDPELLMDLDAHSLPGGAPN